MCRLYVCKYFWHASGNSEFSLFQLVLTVNKLRMFTSVYMYICMRLLRELFNYLNSYWRN